MNVSLRITLLVAIAVYFICIIFLLKKKRLELKYTLLWFFCGALMFILILFPQIITKFAEETGIIDEVNGVFAVILFFGIIILISITSIISKLCSDLRSLVQKCALYEKRIRELEER